ncbi:MAG: helix-turn-helix domain-containing protein [Nitrospirota bacterium]
MNISQLIIQPESNILDFKQELTNPDNIAVTMIAFSNSKGGKIVVGYDSAKKKVIGVKGDMQKQEEWVMNVATTNCSPLISPKFEEVDYKRKKLLIITIPCGSQKPYYLASKGFWDGVYIRVGSTNRRADKGKIQQLLREAQNISYDETPLSQALKNDIDIQKVKRYLEIRANKFNTPVDEITDILLKNIGVLVEHNSTLVPTVGGILLFGRQPQRYLMSSWVRCARFKGKDKSVFIDRVDLEDALPSMIDEAVRFVERNIRMGAYVPEGQIQRVEMFEYPISVVREAITNAVIHRDYSSNAAVMIAIYDDRIEIDNPGDLPGELTLTNFIGRSLPRNKMIARRMMEMNYIEEWGRGIKLMNDGMKERGLPLPKFSEIGYAFKATLYGQGEKFMKEKERAIESKLNERQKKVIEYLARKEYVTRRGYCSLFKVGKSVAFEELSKMIKNGIVKRIGKGPATRYIIVR